MCDSAEGGRGGEWEARPSAAGSLMRTIPVAPNRTAAAADSGTQQQSALAALQLLQLLIRGGDVAAAEIFLRRASVKLLCRLRPSPPPPPPIQVRLSCRLLPPLAAVSSFNTKTPPLGVDSATADAPGTTDAVDTDTLGAPDAVDGVPVVACSRAAVVCAAVTVGAVGVEAVGEEVAAAAAAAAACVSSTGRD